jgi:iron-sulfur cluster assembly accessory protein
MPRIGVTRKPVMATAADTCERIMSTPNVQLTDRAAARIAEIAAVERVAANLRLAVDGGGCSGFQYKFDLVDAIDSGDLVIERGGARLLVDAVSLPFVLGAEIDFVDDLIGASFKVKNPNATASCGCGTSFSV